MMQAVADPFIWVPNGIGGFMTVVLISLTLIYPAAATTLSSSAGSSADGLAAPLNAP